MTVPPVLLYLLLLLAITYFRTEHMVIFNNVLGKLLLLAFVSFSAYKYGIPTGVVSSLICVMILHTTYEGFKEGKIGQDNGDENNGDDQDNGDENNGDENKDTDDDKE